MARPRYQAVERCERRGLMIAGGAEWFPAEPTGAFVRLSYAGPHPSRFAEAARILSGVLVGPS